MDKSAQKITPGVPRRRLGQGLEVSAIGLGCMEMSWYYGAEGCDEDASLAAIRRALDLGVNLLDTADDVVADLIVVGCRGRGFTKRHLLGSVSTRLAQHTHHSILIVHSEHGQPA